MLTAKSPEEIEIMRAGGKITAQVLKEILNSVKPGVKLNELDKKAEDLISYFGAEPSFKRVAGYSFATCININEGVVHGLPSERRIKVGDVVSVDLGVYYRGFHTDAAWTVIAGDGDRFFKLATFLKVGSEALARAIKACTVGAPLGSVSRVIQETIEGAGYSVVRDLVGHGIGRDLHESPEVPGYTRKGYDLELKEGLVLAIEVIYNEGDWPVVLSQRDGWTMESEDGSMSGLFEHTVAVSKSGPIVLTAL